MREKRFKTRSVDGTLALAERIAEMLSPPKLVILRGEVSSWSERDEAQATAWSAPGVTHVRNTLSIKI